MTKRKKILLWVAGVLAGLFIILLLTLQFLVPAVINSESIKSKIETLASEEIGADITFQRIDLSLLPRLTIVVHQFSLSAPGTAEGTVKTVRVYPKLFHLLTGKFHIARAVVEALDFAIVVSEGPEAKKQRRPKKQKEKTTFTEDMEEVLGPIFGFLVPSPGMEVTINQCTLDLTEGTKPLFAIRNMDVKVVFPSSGSENIPYQEILSAESSGLHKPINDNEIMQAGIMSVPLSAQAAPAGSSLWRFRVLMDMKNVEVQSRLLPGHVRMTGGVFEILHDRLSFRHTQIETVKTSLNLSGSFNNYQKKIDALTLSTDGILDPEVMRWITKLAGVHREFKLIPPVTLRDLQFTLDERDDMISFKGTVSGPKGVSISGDVTNSRKGLNIRNITIKDKVTDATVSLIAQKRILDFSFVGNIAKTTLDRLLYFKQFPNGWMNGNFRVHLSFDDPARSTARGSFTGKNFYFLAMLGLPMYVERLSLNAKDDIVSTHMEIRSLGDSRHLIQRGTIDLSEDHTRVDMDITADILDFSIIEKFMKDSEGEKKAKKDSRRVKRTGPKMPFSGSIRFKANKASYKHFTVRPLHATITLSRDGLRVDVPDAVICNVSTKGHFSLINDDVTMEFTFAAKDQHIQPLLFCFVSRDIQVTGTANLDGAISSKGKAKETINNVKGNITVNAVDGRIDYAKGIANILSYLNVTEIFRGKFKDLRQEGLVYNATLLKVRLKQGKVVLEEFVLDGATLDMTAVGTVDLVTDEIDAKVLVAPIKTGNVVVQALPIIRHIFKGTFVTVPIKITGTMEDPEVTYNPIKEVGSGLVGIMKRTLQTPFRMINPDEPGGEEQELVE